MLLALAVPWAARGGRTHAPGGYRVVHRDQSVAGAEHLRLVRDNGPVVANVLRLDPRSGLRLRTVLSGERVAGGAPAYEKTTSMCRRVNCLFAVNADFANLATGEPVGATVVDGQFTRSPVPHHHQFMVGRDGKVSVGNLIWSGHISDAGGLLRTPFTVGINGVNVSRQSDQVILYTANWAASTGTGGDGVEIVARVTGAGGPLPAGGSIGVELVELRLGDSPIPPWGVVLSGSGKGADALRLMWAKSRKGEITSRMTVQIESFGAEKQSVGAYPVLVRDGRPVYLSARDGFTRSRHPRTIGGRTADGTVLLVTVDGRQPCCSIGMTLPEAADFMIALGAVEAVNLDGGGSTTFVAHGVMVNHPSNQLVFRNGRTVVDGTPGPGDLVLAHLERPVTTALAVVRDYRRSN